MNGESLWISGDERCDNALQEFRNIEASRWQATCDFLHRGSMTSCASRWSIGLLIALVILSGCGRSPEARKARHLERGAKYFSQQQYREAIIEYRNALQIDEANAVAIRQMGLAAFHLGQAAEAFPLLRKSAELTPEQLDVRVKLGALYLAARRFDQASAEAAYVLQREPRNLEALLVLAGATQTPGEIDAMTQRLEEARASLGQPTKLYVALGALFFFQAEDGIRDLTVTGVQTCALPIYRERHRGPRVRDRRAWQGTPCGRGEQTAVQEVGSGHGRCFLSRGSPLPPGARLGPHQIGRASCRERV